jgi:hypothetical protein
MDALKEIANALDSTADEVERKLRHINSQCLRACAFTDKKEELWSGEAIPYQMVWPFPPS